MKYKDEKLYNYMFESTLNAKQICLKMFQDGFCVMVKYSTAVNISCQTVSYRMSM